MKRLKAASLITAIKTPYTEKGEVCLKTYDFLIEQQCDIGQGYFFGKPMSLDELKKVLENNE